MAPERGLHNLRMTVYLLRLLLGSKTSVRHAALVYRLERSLAVWADVHVFDAALSRSEQAPGQAAIRPLEEALEVYRGPLLADSGWRWVEQIRLRYRSRAVRAFLRLADLVAPLDLARSDRLAEQALGLQQDSQAAYEQLLRNARARHDLATVHDLTRRYHQATTQPPPLDRLPRALRAI
jgi:two-component SAPR family response regulator